MDDLEYLWIGGSCGEYTLYEDAPKNVAHFGVAGDVGGSLDDVLQGFLDTLDHEVEITEFREALIKEAEGELLVEEVDDIADFKPGDIKVNVLYVGEAVKGKRSSSGTGGDHSDYIPDCS